VLQVALLDELLMQRATARAGAGSRARLVDASATLTAVVCEDDSLYLWGMGNCIFPPSAQRPPDSDGGDGGAATDDFIDILPEVWPSAACHHTQLLSRPCLGKCMHSDSITARG
jgi:hypothetical protein